MVKFERKKYIEKATLFESQRFYLNADEELCEFNEDPESLALELAYTRYALAKAEEVNARAYKLNTRVNWAKSQLQALSELLNDRLEEPTAAEIDRIISELGSL